MANTVSSGDRRRSAVPHHPQRCPTGAACRRQPGSAQAQANVRGYFTANPGEYYDLRGILALIGDVQRTCDVSVLPPNLSAAYDQFMAG